MRRPSDILRSCDRVASTYDEIHPPAERFDLLVSWLPERATMGEVGPGTG
ncbi:MAG TPA: hypothetical protein VGP82_18810 [Ktedonobacterales bacterium]|nr:hypothetical protein [Ktedonobacterales bacterium]